MRENREMAHYRTRTDVHRRSPIRSERIPLTHSVSNMRLDVGNAMGHENFCEENILESQATLEKKKIHALRKKTVQKKNTRLLPQRPLHHLMRWCLMQVRAAVGLIQTLRGVRYYLIYTRASRVWKSTRIARPGT